MEQSEHDPRSDRENDPNGGHTDAPQPVWYTVRFHQAFVGGGFGRRVDMDFVIEAIVLSNLLNTPVKVTWTAEDDHRHGRLRPGSHHKVSVKLKQGEIVGWYHRIASQSVMTDFISGFIADTPPGCCGLSGAEPAN